MDEARETTVATEGGGCEEEVELDKKKYTRDS